MAEERTGRSGRGVPDELRAAVERTFAAVSGSTAGSRERAQELLDEAVRRGQEAREAVTRRGNEARDTLEKELESLRQRVGELESALGRATSRDKKKG
jgi:polyhydroxyalkanoate synthesis regulator phasin